MFPFLPALILLLLQGPAQFERVLAQGIWWAGSDAVVRSVSADIEATEEQADVICLPVVRTAYVRLVVEKPTYIDRRERDGAGRHERIRDGPGSSR